MLIILLFSANYVRASQRYATPNLTNREKIKHSMSSI